MKKVLCIILSVFFCMTLIACASTSSNVTEVSSTVDIVQERKDKLESAFETNCDSTKEYATLSSDGTSLVIDSNPDDDGYYMYSSEAISAIVNVNKFLSLPASVTQKMESTRALDGMQSQDCGDYTVSWTYHPDNGLKVIYEVNAD